jgi:hypothetical protein
MTRSDEAVLFDLHDTPVHLVPSTEEAMATVLGTPVEDYRSAWRTIDERIEKGEWAPASEDRWTELYAPMVDSLGLPFSPAEVAARLGELFRSVDAYAAFAVPLLHCALSRVPDAVLPCCRTQISLLSRSSIGAGSAISSRRPFQR